MAIATIARPRETGIPVNPSDRLIAALDVPTRGDAERLITRLDGVVSTFKIGLQLQLSIDVKFINEIAESGKKLFLDYKYFDIGRTVKEAVSQAADLGVSFLTVHGNGDIINSAVEGRGSSEMQILSVTVLTSLDQRDIQELGFQCNVEELVLHRAKRSYEAGCDGVIASGHEAEKIREEIGSGLLIVTPAIRPEGDSSHDQKRVSTPSEAIAAGADYLVIGRPIYQDPDPASKAASIIEDMAAAFKKRAI